MKDSIYPIALVHALVALYHRENDVREWAPNG